MTRGGNGENVWDIIWDTIIGDDDEEDDDEEQSCAKAYLLDMQKTFVHGLGKVYERKSIELTQKMCQRNYQIK